MNSIQQTELIPGVATCCGLSEATTTFARLTFRVGIADEGPLERGWVHLAEHLLHGPLTAPGELATNASTGPLSVAFDFTGPAEAVAQRMETLASSLADLDLSRLPAEAEVLSAERARRRPTAATAATVTRWGLRPIGGFAQDIEWFAEDPDPEQLSELIGRSFTAQNASLAITGPVPDLGRVELPPGAHMDLPGGMPGTCGVSHLSDELALSSVHRLRQTPAPEHALLALQWRLTEILRADAGIAYSPSTNLVRVADDLVWLIATSDLTRWDREVHARVERMLDELAAHGPDADLLDGIRRQRQREFHDPQSQRWHVVRAAQAALFGDPVLSPDERADAEAAVTAEQIADVVTEWRTHLLWGVPDQSAMPEAVPRHAPPPAVRNGTNHRSSQWPNDPFQVWCGDEGISILGPGTDASIDGFRLTFLPEQWQSGEDLVARIRRSLPDHLSTEHSDQATKTTVPQERPLARWVRQARNHPSWNGAFIVLIVLDGLIMALVLVLALNEVIPGWSGAIGLAAALAIGGFLIELR